MSSFVCEKCGELCIDTDYGYVRGCEHFPPDAKPTLLQLAKFTEKEYGRQIEWKFVSGRLILAEWGIGPALHDWEELLLLFLIEAWRDSLLRH